MRAVCSTCAQGTRTRVCVTGSRSAGARIGGGGGGGTCVVQVRGVWFVLAVNSGTSEHAKEEARGDDAFGRG